MAISVAKNVVAAGLADRCEVQVSYAIGVAEPTSVSVDTFGTGTVSEAEITARILSVFDLTPYGIKETLQLERPIYRPTAAYGHFGRTEDTFSWEKTNMVDTIREKAGI